MNAARFQTELANALGDPTNAVYTSSALQSAQARAVREYSRYFPLKRRFGTGSLVSDVTQGSNTATVSGGPYPTGTILNFDLFGQTELMTVQSAAPAVATSDDVGNYTVLTFSANLAHAHPAGAFCMKKTLGLSLVAGMDTYALPQDWISPDRDSFDQAVGARRWVKRTESFYDGLQTYANLISGVGYGLSQGFAAAGSMQGGAFAATPDGSSFNPPGGPAPSQVQYDVLMGWIPMLVVRPAPTQAMTLDFFYQAVHSPDTIPDWDMEMLVAYGQYASLSARAKGMRQMISGKEKDVEKDYSKQVQSLLDLADLSLKDFKRQVASRPYVVSG